MLLWPTITALGFAALIAVVIALGTRSTARYEAERERAGGLASRRSRRLPEVGSITSPVEDDRPDRTAGPERVHPGPSPGRSGELTQREPYGARRQDTSTVCRVKPLRS